MIIKWKSDKNFEIKTKTLSLEIGDKNKLGTLEIDGPGEYEVSGVQMDVANGIIQIYGEGMNIGHIQKAKVLSDDDLQKLNGIDILLIGVGGDKFSETKTAIEVINQIEPSVVIPMYKDNLEEFTKEEGKNISPIDELKISKTDLNPDVRQVVILNSPKNAN